MGIEIPQNKFLILDGAMGTVLQQRGLSPQGRPELLNLTEPELLDSVYKEYIAAGRFNIPDSFRSLLLTLPLTVSVYHLSIFNPFFSAKRRSSSR